MAIPRTRTLLLARCPFQGESWQGAILLSPTPLFPILLPLNVIRQLSSDDENSPHSQHVQQVKHSLLPPPTNPVHYSSSPQHLILRNSTQRPRFTALWACSPGPTGIPQPTLSWGSLVFTMSPGSWWGPGAGSGHVHLLKDPGGPRVPSALGLQTSGGRVQCEGQTESHPAGERVQMVASWEPSPVDRSRTERARQMVQGGLRRRSSPMVTAQGVRLGTDYRGAGDSLG